MVATHPWMNAAERWQRINTSKITDIVRSVVHDIESGAIVSDEDSALLSLKRFLHIVDGPSKRRAQTFTGRRRAPEQSEVSLPPFDAAVTVLRWAKANDDDDAQTGWMCHILPREMFQEACQRVYFAIDDHDEVDFILANGYLTYVFADYKYTTQIEEYQDHGELCRLNLQNAMLRLPLHALPSLKLVAALALSAFTAIESSQAFMAWNFVSTALNMCQTLGYHRNNVYNAAEQAMQDAQSRLFWLIYRLERSLSFRFNRSSNIRDSEITIPENPASMRHIRLGRIHGKIYELLYSPAALAETNAHWKGNAAELLATELQQMTQEMKEQLRDGSSEDLTKRIHLLCDLICQSSTLTLILRAVSPSPGASAGVSDQCVATAREVLDMHQECMATTRSCVNDPFKVVIYANWNLVHVPFVPFMILFSRAVQLCDLSDLALLERFAASLQTEIASSDSPTHTFQLYEILYQTARLHISRHSHITQTGPTISKDLTSTVPDLDFAQFGADAGLTTQSSSPFGTTAAFDLSSWYYDNQHLMSLLDDNTTF